MTIPGVHVKSVPNIEPLDEAKLSACASQPEQAEAILREAALAQVLSGAVVDVEDAAITVRVDQMIDQFKVRLTEAQVTFEHYLAESEKDEDEIRAQLRDLAAEAIKKEAVLHHVSEVNHIEVLPEDLEHSVKTLAQLWDIGVDETRDKLAREGRLPGLFQAILFEKVGDFILRTALGEQPVKR
jgi:trigger factor